MDLLTQLQQTLRGGCTTYIWGTTEHQVQTTEPDLRLSNNTARTLGLDLERGDQAHVLHVKDVSTERFVAKGSCGAKIHGNTMADW